MAARVPYITKDNLAPEHQAIWDEISKNRGGVGRNFRAFLNSPEAARRLAALGEYLRFQSPLDLTLRAVATLAVAREMGSDYVWTAQEEIARRVALADSIIKAIRERTAPKGLRSGEAAIFNYTHELLRNHVVSDSTFLEAHQLLGDRGIVDLTVTIGYYSVLCLAISALKVEMNPGIVSTLEGVVIRA